MKRRILAHAALAASVACGGRSAEQPTDTTAKQPATIDAMSPGQLASACDQGKLDACSELGRREIEAPPNQRNVADALARFNKACDGNNPAACGQLGKAYALGIGVVADLTKAVELLKRGCDGHDQASCLGIAVLQADGRGLPQDYEAAYKTFEQLCTASFARACSDLVVMLGTPNSPHADPVRARQVAKQACDGSDADGCYYYGEILQDGIGGGSADVATVDPVMRRACTLGNVLACQLWGAYLAFAASPKNPADGAKLLRIGCDREDGKSCHALAVLVQNGAGGPPDQHAAVELAHRACDLGEAGACTLVGLDMMQKNQGSNASLAVANEAVAMFVRSCKDGVDTVDPPGCFYLGLTYEEGVGTPRDPEHAVKLFNRACEKELPDACEHLGEMYDRGVGVARDADKAKELFNKACDKGNQAGCVAVGRPAPH